MSFHEFDEIIAETYFEGLVEGWTTDCRGNYMFSYGMREEPPGTWTFKFNSDPEFEGGRVPDVVARRRG